MLHCTAHHVNDHRLWQRKGAALVAAESVLVDNDATERECKASATGRRLAGRIYGRL